MKRSSFIRIRSHRLEVLLAPNLAALPWLVHGFSTRVGGSSPSSRRGLDLGRGSGRSAAAAHNRCLFLSALGVRDFRVVALDQIHSATVFEVTKKDSTPTFNLFGYELSLTPRRRPAGDAVVTRGARLLLEIRTADCLPILLADVEGRALAAIHSGWRGALARVVEKTVGEMRRLYGTRPERVLAALGPSVGPCCYEVGEEVVDAFTGCFVNSKSFFQKASDSTNCAFSGMPFLSLVPPGHARREGSGYALDLAAVARDQLVAAGVKPAHIKTCGLCTSCNGDLFFSYRRDGASTGRMAAVIGLRS